MMILTVNNMMVLTIILLIMNCYFTWQIAIAPRQLKQFGDFYLSRSQEQSESLEEINTNLSNILERLGGEVTLEEQMHGADY